MQCHQTGGQRDPWRLGAVDISTRINGPKLFLTPSGRSPSVAWPCLPWTAASSSCCSPWNRAVQASEGNLLFKHSLIPELSLWCRNNQPSSAFSKLGFLHQHLLSHLSLGKGSLLGFERYPNLFILSAPETGNFDFILHNRRCSLWCIYFKTSLLRGLQAGTWFHLTQWCHETINSS